MLIPQIALATWDRPDAMFSGVWPPFPELQHPTTSTKYVSNLTSCGPVARFSSGQCAGQAGPGVSCRQVGGSFQALRRVRSIAGPAPFATRQDFFDRRDG